MESDTDNTIECPRCGFQNTIQSENWLRLNEKTNLCSRCGKPVFEEDIKEDSSSFLKKFIFFAAIISLLVLYLNKTFGNGFENNMHFAYEFFFIVFVSVVLASGKIWNNIRDLSIWFLIIVSLLAAYSFRNEIAYVKDRVISELVPSKGFKTKQKSISFRASSNGHFYIMSKINGTSVQFLADTGASDIVLSGNDAERIGIDISKIRYNRIYNTANGVVRGGTVRVKNLQIGGISLKNVTVSVNEAEMNESLLGMTFFNRLKGYEVKNNTLTLYWD